MKPSIILSLIGVSALGLCGQFASGQETSQAQAITPPVMPKIQETPLLAPVAIGLPAGVVSDLPNKPLTVDEAVQIALHKQPSLTVAKEGVNSAKAREQESKSGLLPTVSVTALHNSVNGAASSDAGSLGSSGYQASATLHQLVFDFNHTRDLVKESREQEISAQANLTRAQADLILQVKQAFYTFIQNQRLVEVNESNVTNRGTHVSLAQARLKTGVGLPSDVVRAETAVSEAVLSLNLAQTAAMTSRITLASLMGVDPRTPLAAESSETALNLTSDLSVWVDMAFKNRPEMAQAVSNLNASRYALGAAKTGNAPALSGTLGWGEKGTDLPLDGKAVTIGVQVQFNPFDSGLTSGKIREARSAVSSAESQVESAKLSIISDVSQSYLNCKTAQQRVETAQAEVANADEGLRLAQGRYQSGLGTFLDVLDAQTAEVTAKTNQVNAVTAMEQARAALSHAAQSPVP